MHESDAADVLDRWPGMQTKGDRSLLSCNLLAMIWPESWTTDVSEAIDAVRELRDAGVAVASGFGSAMEGLSIELLLEGQQPVVVCFFKAIKCYELPLNWKKAIDAGRLLVIAPLPGSVRRKTKSNVRSRNKFIAAIASAVFMLYASPTCNDEVIAREVMASNKPLFTFEGEENPILVQLGARRYDVDEIRRVTVGRSK